MTTKGNGAVGPGRTRHDAAEQRQHSTPTDAAALAALRVVADWLGLGASAPADYDQDHLPPGCKSTDGYKRLHRTKVKTSVEGWTTCGQSKLVTADAWREHIETETAKRRAQKPKLTVVPASVDDLDARLGIRLRKAVSR